MASEMVERVRKVLDAVFGAELQGIAEEYGSPDPAKERYETTRDAARAAIEAMREPTEAMQSRVSPNIFDPNRLLAFDLWQIMIGEALKE